MVHLSRPVAQYPPFLLHVLDTMPAAAYTCDSEGMITYCNRNAVEVWGRTPRINDPADRYCGSFRLYFADGTPMPHDRCCMALALRDQASYNGHEVLIEQPDGSLRSALAHANPMLDEHGLLLGASNILVDITERKRFEERLAYQATHDELTGLPNRSMLLRTLEERIGDSPGAPPPFALLLLDLDRFKGINDSFGHEYGDAVLKQMRPRLIKSASREALVARLGGDEFGVVLPGAAREEARRVAESILAAVARPLAIRDQHFDMGTSIGIALAPEHGRDAATLLRHADVAMYAAKRARSGAAFYADSLQLATPYRLSMTAELRRAIEGGGLRLFYQPIVDVQTGEIASVEALARWPHPVRGIISPGEFLPLAEAEGLMRRLDLWAFGEAARKCRAWRADGLVLPVNVNLSAESLLDIGFVDDALGLLDDGEDLAGLLTIELTERAVVSDPDRVGAALERFHSRGVRIALDDFGTGYSSLAHLKQLRIDEVKLDSSFVRKLPGSRLDAAISEAVISLGKKLWLVIVAEGVEHREALKWLSDRGCCRAQGYFWSPALPPTELTHWLATSNRGLDVFDGPRPAPGPSTTEAGASPPGVTDFFQRTLDALIAHVAILRSDGTIVAVNAAWNRFATQNGLVENLCGPGVNYLKVCEDATGSCSEQAGLIANGIRDVGLGLLPNFELEYPCHTPTRQLWALARVSRFEVGSEVYIVVIHDDITDRKLTELRLQQANRLLEAQATTDGLTGLSNRRHFDAELSREWDRHVRNASVLSVLLIDIDHFKKYNDSRGHLEGDDCLREVSRLIESAADRAGDLVARFGGEEFAVILSETDRAGALAVAGRITEAIRRRGLPHEAPGAGPTLTLSIGCASVVPSSRTTPEDLLKRADDALYLAKANGRDRVEQADGS